MKLSFDFPLSLIAVLLSVAILLSGSEVTTATSSTARKEQQQQGKTASLRGLHGKSSKSAKEPKGIDHYTTLPPTDSMSDNVTDDGFIDFAFASEDVMLSNYSLSEARSKS